MGPDDKNNDSDQSDDSGSKPGSSGMSAEEYRSTKEGQQADAERVGRDWDAGGM